MNRRNFAVPTTGPPNETGRSDDPARLKSTATTAKIVEQFREINRAAPTSWVKEGWRLFVEYQNSGSEKHLGAFRRHVAGIRARMMGPLASAPLKGVLLR
jgi:hypothetical protein